MAIFVTVVVSDDADAERASFENDEVDGRDADAAALVAATAESKASVSSPPPLSEIDGRCERTIQVQIGG